MLIQGDDQEMAVMIVNGKYCNNDSLGELVLPPPSFTMTRQQIHIKCFAIYPPSKMFLDCQLGFHIFITMAFLGPLPFFAALLFWIRYHFFLHLYTPKQTIHQFFSFFTCLFLFYRKERGYVPEFKHFC